MKKNRLIVLRAIAGVFLPILGLSWVWFGGYFSPSDHVVMLVIIIALFIAVITPAETYAAKQRFILAGFFLAGAVAASIDIYKSYSLGYGPDYLAMALKSIYFLILIMLTKNALTPNEKSLDA